jgi:hypothetical protein
MAKQVSFGAKPKTSPNLENWVENREVPAVESVVPLPPIQPTPEAPSSPKLKRLTLDIPDELHRKIKGKAVAEGVTMVEMLRELLETNYS